VLVLLWTQDTKTWKRKTYRSGVVKKNGTAFDLICQFGFKGKAVDQSKLNRDIERFIQSDKSKKAPDCISNILDGLIVYLECVHELIPDRVSVETRDKSRTIKFGENQVTFSYGEKTDCLPIDRKAVDEVIQKLRQHRKRESWQTYEMRMFFDKGLLFNTYAQGDWGKGYIDATLLPFGNKIRSIMELASHTEIQALVDHILRNIDINALQVANREALQKTIQAALKNPNKWRISKNVFSTKLSCLNCAMFLAHANNKLFNDCNFIGVVSRGFTDENLKQYPLKVCAQAGPFEISFRKDMEGLNKMKQLCNLTEFLKIGDGATPSDTSLSIAPSPKSEKEATAKLTVDDLATKEVAVTKGSEIPKGMVGLEWFDRHCYANAAFQFLLACDPVCNFITTYKGDDKFIKAIKVLFDAMGKNRESANGYIIAAEDDGDKIGLRTLYKLIGQVARNSTTTQYAEVIKGLGTSVAEKDAYEVIGDIVGEVAKQRTELRGLCSSFYCPNCGKITSKKDLEDSCLEIVLGGKSISECLKKTFDQKKIEYTCGTCRQSRDIVTSTEFENLPDVLILRLERFRQIISTRGEFKIGDDIAYNKVLKIPEELLSTELKNSNQNGVYYRLKAVVNHAGTVEGGHYTATILNDKENKWYTANGPSIAENNGGNFKHSKDAYVFMYKRIDGKDVDHADYEEKVEDDDQEGSKDTTTSQSEGKKDASTQTPKEE
jgi:hypothetical protein